MTDQGLDVLERSTHKTNEWLKDLAAELDSGDKREAYHALRGFFHVLRDRLTVEESADLAAQLPQFLRGVFYEGWRPAKVPETYHDRDTFLRLLAAEAQLVSAGEAKWVARACVATLRRHVSEGELEDVFSQLPGSIREVLKRPLATESTQTG